MWTNWAVTQFTEIERIVPMAPLTTPVSVSMLQCSMTRVLPSLLSYCSHSWASPVARQLFFPLSVPKVSSTSMQSTCTSEVSWVSISLLNLQHAFLIGSRLTRVAIHEIYLKWALVWLCWRVEFHKLESHAVHNPTSVKTLWLSSVTWWWVRHEGHNFSKCWHAS